MKIIMTLETPGSMVTLAWYLKYRIRSTTPKENDVGPKNLQTDFK